MTSSVAGARRRVRHVLRQARRYLGTVLWFFAKVFREQPRRSLTVFVASGSGLALVALGFGVVFTVLSGLEAGELVDVAGLVVDPSSARNLALIAGIAAITVAGGAGLLFVARHHAVVAAAELQRTMASEVTAAHGPAALDPTMFLSDQRLITTLTSLQTSEARRCALSVRRGLETPVQLVVVVGGFVLLFLLEPLAAFGSTLFATVALPFLYVVNVRGVRASKRYEALMGPSRATTRSLLEDLARRFDLTPSAARAQLAGLPHVWPAIDAFRDRFVAVVRADLASQLIAATTTFALLAYLGSAALDGRMSLVVLGTFMVLLRLTLGALRSVFVSLTTISRYYPSMYRYQQFLHGLRPVPPGVVMPNEATPRAGPRALAEPGVALGPLEAGSIVSLTTPVSPSRYATWYFGLVLAGGDPTRAAVWRDRIKVATAVDDLSDASADAAAALLVDATLLPDGQDIPRPTAFRTPSLTLIWNPGKPRRTSATIHLVAGPDGHVVAWGRPRWVREHWQEIHALRREASEAFESRHAEVRGEDAEDDE